MAAKEQMKITDLNKDCLLKIFKYLSLNDLCQLKLISELLKRNHPHFQQAVDYSIRHFFVLFGNKINELKIDFSEHPASSKHRQSLIRFFQNLIRIHCSEKSFWNFRFGNFEPLNEFDSENTSFIQLLRQVEFISQNDIDWFSDMILVSKRNDEVPKNYRKILFTSENPFDPVWLTYFPNIEYLFLKNYSTIPLFNAVSDLTSLETLSLTADNIPSSVLSSFLSKLAERNTLEIFFIDITDIKDNDNDVMWPLEENLHKMTNLGNLSVRLITKMKIELKNADLLLKLIENVTNLTDLSLVGIKFSDIQGFYDKAVSIRRKNAKNRLNIYVNHCNRIVTASSEQESYVIIIFLYS